MGAGESAGADGGQEAQDTGGQDRAGGDAEVDRGHAEADDGAEKQDSGGQRRVGGGAGEIGGQEAQDTGGQSRGKRGVGADDGAVQGPHRPGNAGCAVVCRSSVALSRGPGRQSAATCRLRTDGRRQFHPAGRVLPAQAGSLPWAGACLAELLLGTWRKNHCLYRSKIYGPKKSSLAAKTIHAHRGSLAFVSPSFASLDAIPCRGGDSQSCARSCGWRCSSVFRRVWSALSPADSFSVPQFHKVNSPTNEVLIGIERECQLHRTFSAKGVGVGRLDSRRFPLELFVFSFPAVGLLPNYFQRPFRAPNGDLLHSAGQCHGEEEWRAGLAWPCRRGKPLLLCGRSQLGERPWLDGGWTGELWAGLIGGTSLATSFHASGDVCVSEQVSLRIRQSPKKVGGVELRLVVEQPSREQSAGAVLDPFIQQNADFLAKVCRVVQAREFIALERGCGSKAEVLPRRVKRLAGHLTPPRRDLLRSVFLGNFWRGFRPRSTHLGRRLTVRRGAQR